MRTTLPFSLLLAATAVSTCVGQSHPLSENATSLAAPAQDGIKVRMAFSDRAGKSIPPPSLDSLQVQFDGKPAEIIQLKSLRDEPLYFSMLVDTSGSTQLFADQEIVAASKLFRALVTGNNHGYLVIFNEKVAASKETISAENVEEALKEFPPKSRWGPTALYDALVFACTQELPSTVLPPNARRAIIVFSDGGDNASRHSLRLTLETAQREGIPIFPISPTKEKDMGSSSSQKREGQALRTLSQGTGGMVTILDDPGSVIASVTRFIEGQDLASIRTATLDSKKSHSLKIEAPGREIHILVQAEYVGP